MNSRTPINQKSKPRIACCWTRRRCPFPYGNILTTCVICGYPLAATNTTVALEMNGCCFIVSPHREDPARSQNIHLQSPTTYHSFLESRPHQILLPTYFHVPLGDLCSTVE